MLLSQLSALVSQDPQEMIWIEAQGAILAIMFVCFLILWPIAEYYRYNVKAKKRNLVRHGMNYLFSFNNDTK